MVSNMNAWIATHSGKKFYFDSPEQFEYSLNDIGFSLANLCRYAGHGGWWSVAQHSLALSDLAEPKDKLRALLHDATEAYLVDVPGPLKHMEIMQEYCALERRVGRALNKQFGLPEDTVADKRVKQLHMSLSRTEAEMLGLVTLESLESWPAITIPEWLKKLPNDYVGKVFETQASSLLKGEADLW